MQKKKIAMCDLFLFVSIHRLLILIFLDFLLRVTKDLKKIGSREVLIRIASRVTAQWLGH